MKTTMPMECLGIVSEDFFLISFEKDYMNEAVSHVYKHEKQKS